ncbi:hypothetical protein TEA_007134 [Camellia sinensis var. sinensis]|uniref:USP domain-containing protein n=1 Tax=Camellia sinensis var. sinensis TaxID=542762 RepID=A0A4S4DLZ9_CAMSN|nr:hypothetical protein TEA_007134 [Camellia sinensis var. sinensis]
MPLNSFPSIVAEEAFELKSFMCPLGINDFPMTNADHIKEEAANRELLTVANDARAGGPAEGAHLHIVHLSDARSSLDLIKEAKSGDSNGDSTTIGFGALPHQKSLHRSSRWRLQMLATRSWARFSRKVYNSKQKKKADAAREALLSEIELEAKKKKDFESKKKNKNQRKNKDPKVTQGDDLYVPQEETEEPVHFPVSYNGDYPSSVIVVAARADELGLQEEELKHEIEHDVEERKLEEKLEYQRQIAEEDKHTNLAKQNKHAVAASIAEEVEEMDVACATDLGPGLRNVGENNCFINVIIQIGVLFKEDKNDASEAILDVLHWSFTFAQHDHPNELLKCDIREKHQNSCGGCSKRNIPHCILSTPPRVHNSWESLEEPAHKISATLGALSTKIDIGVIYEGLDPGNTHYLISMVCYGLEHYICLVYNRAKEIWILYDNDKVKVIGSWDGVLTMCSRKRLQPQLLFFEVKGSVSVTPLEETKVLDNP